MNTISPKTTTPTVNVTLRVQQFVPGGRCLFARPEIDPSATRLQFKNPEIPSDTAIKAIGDQSSPLDIAFTIPGYAPQGIEFKPLRPQDGIDTFNNVRIKGSTITVTDLFLQADKGEKMPGWDYSITVVPLASPDVQPGTIDPEIDNQTDLDEGV